MKKIFFAAAFLLTALCAVAQTTQQKLVDTKDAIIANRVFFDGQWRYRWFTNGRLQGGVVSWVTGLTFAVTSAKYMIEGREYSSAGGQITLDAAHPSLPRFDVLALNTSGAIVKITGTAASVPAIPQINQSTQIYLTAIYLPGGATQPTGVSNLTIYDEDTEWPHAQTGFTGGISFASTASPYIGTKSINTTGSGATDVSTGGGMKFANGGTTYGYSNYTLLRFYIKLKAALPSTATLSVALGVGNETLTPITAAHGFNPALANVYQNITVPMSEFNKLGNSFGAFYLIVTGNGIGYYIDNIQLQSGVTNGTGNQQDTFKVASPLYVAYNSTTGDQTLHSDTVSLTKDGILTKEDYALFLSGGSGIVADSIKLSNDSVFLRKNGVFVFQYMVTGGGGSPQTPWAANIDGNQKTLSNVAAIEVKKVVPGSSLQNLLLFSEQLDNTTNWLTSDITMTGNADGIYDMATITTSGSNRLNSDNGSFAGTPVTPGVTYSFSFEAKRGTATAATAGIYDFTNSTDITPSYDYYSLINSSTYTRVTMTFTAPPGCTGVWLYPLRNVSSTGNIYLGKAQLTNNVGGYVTTTTTTVSTGGGGGTEPVFNADTSGVKIDKLLQTTAAVRHENLVLNPLDTVSKKIGVYDNFGNLSKMNWPVGGTGIYYSDGTIPGERYIDGLGTGMIYWDNFDYYNIIGKQVGFRGSRLGRYSDMVLDDARLSLRPILGNLTIDSLNQSNSYDDKIMVWNTTSGKVGVMDKKEYLEVVQTGDLTNQTSTQNLITYAVPVDAGLFVYDIAAVLTVSAISGGVLTTTIAYYDETNTSRTITYYSMGATTAGVTNTGKTNFPVAGEIQAYAGTTITITTTLTGGTATYNAGATVVLKRKLYF